MPDVKLTHPEKVLFPDDGITKEDLAGYYAAVGDAPLPLMRDRPMNLWRWNAGIGGRLVVQQDIPKGAPEWVERVETPRRKGGSIHHVVCQNADTLRWLANQNCITPHVWLSRADRLERPDRMIFDLDPTSADDFTLVRRTARDLGDVLREAGVEPFAMTTGSRGIHVVVVLQRRYGFGEVRDAAVAVAAELVERRPKDLTTEFYKRKRDGRLFVDVNRNAYAATAVPPYGVRPLAGAPVATPLAWDELSDRRLSARRWTIRTVLDRDPEVWEGVRRAAGALPRI
jgi:bifunctional non-homologous end joining protein LigD